MNPASQNQVIDKGHYLVLQISEWTHDRIEDQKQILEETVGSQQTDWKYVIVNSQGLNYANSLFIAFLIQLANEADSRGGAMKLCNLSSFILDLIQVTHLDQRWKIYNSLDEAEQSLSTDD